MCNFAVDTYMHVHRIAKNINYFNYFHMKAKILLLLLVGIIYCPAAKAWDTEPDAEGLYDGSFDRPTYFQEWEQPSTWANAMTVLSEVRIGSTTGVRLVSYEVAVYDQNNELRHCNRSLPKQNHFCVLTIKGEEGHTFHFRVLCGPDFANPTIVEVTDTELAFETNAAIGTPASPYVLVVPEGTPTDLEEVTGDGLPVTGKIIRNGQLFILRDGKTYSVTGAEVES